MRSGDPESQIDVSFDCGVGTGGLKRTEAHGFKHLRVEILSGSISKIATGACSVPSGINALCFNNSGTLLVRGGSRGRLLVIPPKSVTFIRGGVRLIVQAARGDHSTMMLSWPGIITPLLDNWAAMRAAGRAGQPHRAIACKPVNPQLSDAKARFERALTDEDAAEPLMLSVVYELIARLMVGSDEVQLAAIPLDLPDTILELTKQVRANPTLAWPLKDAADAAGYSPFHFSRVFKSLVSYGFHEYVDRCRTEIAVEMLCNSDSPVDLVASACGFGTTQGLRESIKEYLGLVPSELRAVPDVYGSPLA